MNMTHYMELLADNQPWNLIFFMAIPVVLAETVAITELYLLYTRRLHGAARRLNRLAGIAAGLCFSIIIVYLTLNAVLPITRAGEWRTALDIIAVGTYLLGGIPMILVALQDLGLLHRQLSEEQKLARHAVLVAVFLVLAHIAMIAGMADPGLLGYTGPAHGHEMPMSESVQPSPPMQGHTH